MEAVRGLLVGIIGDKDTVAGFLLTGVGKKTDTESNFYVVDPEKMSVEGIESAFNSMIKRKDIGVILITQTIANEIRHLINNYSQVAPALLEIPSKEIPYDPKKDPVMVRVKQLLRKA